MKWYCDGHEGWNRGKWDEQHKPTKPLSADTARGVHSAVAWYIGHLCALQGKKKILLRELVGNSFINIIIIISSILNGKS